VALGGYTKNTGTVLTIILKANKEGSGSITFKDGQILANDGQGTDLTSGFGGSSFSVKPRAITKPIDTSEEEITEVTKEEIIPKPATPQEPPTLKSPEITLTKLFGEDAVSGTSGYPNSQSLITFISTGGEKIFVQSDTNINGDFRILIPQSLKRGEYTVSAVVIKSDLSHSPPSNQITVNVGNIFSDISSEVKLIISLLILILLYLMIRTYTYLTRNRKIKSHLKQESKEAQSMVHKSFKLLKKDIAEMASVREIKKDLSHAEEEIINEIKDIEKS
jgi:hypothetical protein